MDIEYYQESANNSNDSVVIADHPFYKYLTLHTDIAHLIWEYFGLGISQFVDKDKHSRNNTTGTFSRLRSLAFVSILIQLYLCISSNSDILPNILEYKFIVPNQICCSV
jgi:hypothetical protein